MATRLQPEIAFEIVTTDRDLGDDRPYGDVVLGRWTTQSGVPALYLPPRGRARRLIQLVRSRAHDVLYLNSVFAWRMGILPLVLRRVAGSRGSLLVNPRGELSDGALRYSNRKKRAYLRAARATGLFAGARWHAANNAEAEEIRQRISPSAQVAVASDLAAAKIAALPARTPKPAGGARFVFLSRISPKKNLLAVLAALADVRGSHVSLSIYGPIEDAAHWNACEAEVRRTARAGITVEYHGTITPDQAVEVIARYDAFVLPTFGENYGHVIAEALTAGTPTVLGPDTPWSGVEASGAGWTVEPADHAALTRILQGIVDMQPAEHAARALAARAFAEAALENADRRRDNVRLFEWASGR